MSFKEVARYTGLFILSILLVLSLNATIITLSTKSYLYPEIYQQALSKSNGYDSLTEKISSDPATKFIPKEMLNQQINKLIENILSYARSEKEQLDLTINLDNNILKKSLEQKIADTPICTTNQPQTPGEVPSCRTAGISNDVLLSQLLTSKGISLDRPLTFDLKPYLDKENKLASIKDSVSTFKMIQYAAWILLFISLIVILVLAPSISSKMRWTGLPLFFAGILCLVLQGTLSAAMTDALSSLELDAILGSILSELVSLLKSSLFLYGIIISIWGLVVFATSFFLKSSPKAE